MGGGEIDTDVDGAVNKANKFLQDALLLGLPYSEKFSKDAADAQRYANQENQIQQEGGFERSQGLQAPYRLAGYNALDTYMDTLSMARPDMGSFKLATSLENAAQRDQAIQQLGLEGQRIQDYQHLTGLGEGGGAGDWAAYVHNLNDLDKRMLADNIYPWISQGEASRNDSANTVQRLSARSPVDTNVYGGIPSSSLGGSIIAPQSGTGLGNTQGAALQSMKDTSAALSAYNWAVKNYTNEQGSIAAAFNQGLLKPTVWKDV